MTVDREHFEDIAGRLLREMRAGEHLFVSLDAEESQFVRLSRAKVRQIGRVSDAVCSLTLVIEDGGRIFRSATRAFTLSGLPYLDRAEAADAVARLRNEVPSLPVDPYAVIPKNTGSSEYEGRAELPPPEGVAEVLVAPLGGLDFAGFYAGGRSARGLANSAGQRHWFATDTFTLDYSLYTPSQRAVKGLYSGTRFDRSEYERSVTECARKLPLLEIPPRKLKPGEYRVYLEPEAASDLVAMLSWGAISEASIRQGDSPLRKARLGEVRFSPRFALSEDFSAGRTPRFNSEGELAPVKLDLIHDGKLVSALVSSRSAAEYGVVANGADSDETLRAASVAPGSLESAKKLDRLGTGLWLSNLHYLNWSDQTGGRVTGMTRYACFWVENGKAIAPIENLRFDDSLFRLLGDSLEDLGTVAPFHADTNTFEMRHLGGMQCPAMLLKKMRFTL